MATFNKSDLKVGIFILFGLSLATLVVFLLGNERRVFDTSVEFHTTFQDVQGLKRGAPVNMGGVRVGAVKKVTYGEDPADSTVYVTLTIVERDSGRIKTDSKAQIVNKGLLGDKMIVITKGESKNTLEPGSEIIGEEPGDMLGKVDSLAQKAELTMENVSTVAEELANEQLHKDIRETVASLNTLLKQMTDGDGYPHRFLTDKAEADRISRVIDNLDDASNELTLTLREARLSMLRVRQGPGFAHDLIYGDGLAPEVAQFGEAAQEVAITLKQIREGDGFGARRAFRRRQRHQGRDHQRHPADRRSSRHRRVGQTGQRHRRCAPRRPVDL